jgi:hypothetical protein
MSKNASSLASCCIRRDAYAHHLELPFQGLDPAAELRHVTPARRRLAGRLVRSVKGLQALEPLLFPLHPLVAFHRVFVIARVHGLASITEAAAAPHRLVFAVQKLPYRKARLELDCVAAIDSNGRTIWIADAHRGDGKRFVVRADEILAAFLELEAAIRGFRPVSLRKSCSRTTPAAYQSAHSPYDENQYRDRDNRQRQKVVNRISKNVIWVSRVKAVEAFNAAGNAVKSALVNSSRCSLGW